MCKTTISFHGIGHNHKHGFEIEATFFKPDLYQYMRSPCSTLKWLVMKYFYEQYFLIRLAIQCSCRIMSALWVVSGTTYRIKIMKNYILKVQKKVSSRHSTK